MPFLYVIGLLGVSLLSVSSAHAQITTLPPDLEPGEPYRLVFITKDKIFEAVSANIGDYDAWVTEQANTSAELVGVGTTWRVIGSTSSVSAKVHTGTDDSPTGLNGVPIYRLDGVRIADNYDDLWDGNIQNPLYVAQDGTVLDTCCGTWTGTDTAGNSISGNELGAADESVVDGAPNGTGGNWVQTSPFGANEQQYLYAISGVLANGQAATAISADGVVESTSGGFKFPDGTVQTSSATAPNISTFSCTSTSTCSCPAGLLVGGGADCKFDSVVSSLPTSATTWSATCENAGTPNISILCLN